MNSGSPILETFRTSIIIRLIAIIGGLIVTFGVLIHFLEPKTFPNLFDGIWWSVVTMFTIGYGDFVPHSPLGKGVAILLIVLGTGFGSYYMVAFATEMISRQYMNEKGQMTISLKNHLIIIGWNERVKNIVTQFRTLHPHQDIVLVDETLPNLPKGFSHLFFVRGCPYHDDVMRKAGVTYANTILITADTEKSEGDADTQTILTILTAKGLHPSLYCIAELLTPHQTKNAKRAGANEVIQTNKLTSYVLTTALLFPSVSETFIALCNQITENKIQLLSPKNQTLFRECSHQLLEQNILLIGVKRDGKDYINPPHPFLIQTTDELIVIKN
ncbi:potassium channel family protein [Microbacteriaceae bacterium 4G12]